MTKINNRPILFTLFLGFISSLGPLSIDMGLPGLSGVEAFYNLVAGQGALTDRAAAGRVAANFPADMA